MDAALARCLNPAWCAHPETWEWRTPQGERQGPGINWRREPGLFNLLWLTLDMDRPMMIYDLRLNTLYMEVLLGCIKTRLDDEPLIDKAERLSLGDFTAHLEHGTLAGPLAPYKPVLLMLAKRRLACAHP